MDGPAGRGYVILSMKARTITLAVLLAVVSILAMQPSLAHAAPQSGMVTITARGSATQLGSATQMGGPSPSANIYLKGTVNMNGGVMQLTQMTGILQIGPVFYTVTGGQGQSSSQTAMLQLNLQVGGRDSGTLTLQGNFESGGAGYTVLFTPQQSNLEGQYLLWLYGNLWITQTITTQ